MRNKAAVVKKGDEIISSVGVQPSSPGMAEKLEPKQVTVAGDVATMSKDTNFNMKSPTRLPEKGVIALYSEVNREIGMDRMGTTDVAVLCIDASKPATFGGKVSEFALEAPGMQATAAVVIVATNIDKLVKITQDNHPIERYVDLFVLEAGLTPAASSEVGLNLDSDQLHQYLKDLKPDQKQAIINMAQSFVSGKLTRANFQEAISVKIAEFNNENNKLAVGALPQGNNSPNASKLKAMGQASPKLNRYKLEEVKADDVVAVMNDMANSKTIIDETRNYIGLRVNRDVSKHIEEMAKSVQSFVERANKPVGNVTPSHEVTFVLSSINDPPRKPTAENPKDNVASARKVAEDNKNILSKYEFKNGGAADPMQVALDQVRPSAPQVTDAAKQSPVTKKSTRLAQEAEPSRIVHESSQGLLLDRLKKAFNISGSKIGIESAAAPSGATKNADVTQSPKVSRGIPQWATARPSHSQQEVQGQEKGNSKGAVKAVQSSRAGAESAQSSPVPPRKWAESKVKSSSAPDIRDSKQKEPAAGTSSPKMGK